MEIEVEASFIALIKSLNWYLKRNRDYDLPQFEKWSKIHKSDYDTIKGAYQNFSFDTLTAHIVIFLRHHQNTAKELHKDVKSFLEQYQEIEVLANNTELEQFANDSNISNNTRTQQTNPPRSSNSSLSVAEITDLVTNVVLATNQRDQGDNQGIRITPHLNITIENLTGDGEDVEDWFENYERITNANYWTDDIRARKLPSFLAGSALLSWDHIPCDKTTYKDVRTELLRQLQREESTAEAFYGRRQKPSESVTEYSLRLEKLARRVFRNGNYLEELIRVFWKGLNADLKKFLLAIDPKTMKEATEAAKRAEHYLADQQVEIQSAVTHEATPPNTTKQDRGRRKSSEEEEGHNRNRSQTPNKDELICFRCGNTGHFAKKCHYQRNGSPAPPRRAFTGRCYNCNKLGHRVAECRSKNEHTPVRRG